ncbi:InlB B-repeat-containing protein [Ruminococcus sp.]|uniref:InlB B-repeat-containing protein n=1 Tax=Ruminococcus sp. TaxID=41978 RepID=UPI003FD73EA0
MKTNFKRIGKQSISIVLAVMMMLSTMLVGMVTSNAAETWYVIGDDYDTTWNTNGKSSPMSYDSTTGYYYFDKKLNSTSGNHYFRIHNGSNEYGPTTTNDDISISSYNTKFDAVKDRTAKAFKYSCGSLNYRLWFDATTQKIWITDNNAEPTEPTEPTTPASDIVVYFANPVNNGWTTVCNYIWKSNTSELKTAWPGDEFTDSNVCQSDYSYNNVTYKVYKVTVPAAYDSIIFNNGNNGGVQTGDITGENLADRNLYIYNATATAKVDIIKNYTEPTTQKYTVAVDKNITNGTVTTSETSLAAGKTFTVTATPNDGYELDTITVTDAEGKSVAATNESTHTYTMPASNVTVSATFAQKPDCRLGFGYATGSSDTMGTFSCSSNGTSIVEGTYPYGTEVTFNAVAKEGYVFKGWYSDINGTSDCLSTNTTYTFKLTKETDVFAKFAEATGTVIPNLYLIYSDSTSDPSKFTQYLNLYRDADGQVYAYFDSEHFDSSKTYCFTISDSVGKSTSWEYAYDNYNNSKAVANEANTKYFDCGDSRWGLPKHDESSYVNTAFARFRVLEDYADTISSVKVNLGYYKGTDIVESSTDSTKATTYEIIPDATGTVSSRVKVYAKDGTVRTAYQKYADMADTVISYTGDDVTKKKSADYYEEGYAKLGSTITVTTTIDKDYRSKYYVKAFCVNGYSYGIIDSSKANADGVYSFEYTIPEDCTDKFIEITPIYYYIDDTDTVTFYVEGFDETVQKKWGNTVAVQAWYTNGVDEQKYVDGVLEGEYNSPNKNALGGYPGQPLVYEGGKYSMQIPKYLNGNKDNFVKGITLNNYIWDSIHSGNFKDQINDNCQTYDYDDFYKLSETNDVDNIIFDFRYRNTTDNKPSQAGLSSSTYNKNELEPLKDYYGNIVDIFGNILSKDWTATYDSNYLTVISNGYKEIKNIGKYATEWSVYDKDGTYITTINCSSLIDETKVDSTYQAAYKKLKSHAGLPVKIAYEKSIFQGPDNGTRADGRWYFSKKAQKISANVKIEYKADGTSPFVEDAFVEGSNVGVNTKAQAYFTNADSNGKTTCQGIVDGGNFSVHAQTDVDANYYFIGWYLKTSDGYSFITNESDADFPMTNNATYIARFIPTPSGTLTLSHTLLTGSADGKTFIKADIVDSKGNVKASIAETSGNLVVPARYVVYTSEYSIKATLRTVPYGNDTVEDFYNSNEEHYNSGVTGTGEKTYEVSKTIKELFESYEDVDHNTSYRLIKSNIPFYSNIKSNPLEYTITYTYETRLDGKQSYVIKDKVSGIELEEMWAENVAAGLPKEQLSKAFITKKAPFVSNFRNEIKWDIDHAVINGYIATVDATTKSPDLTITALAVDGGWTKPETVKYGELAVSNGDYLYKTGTTDFPAQYDYNGATKYDFSFWAIFDNREKAAQYSKEVATYMSGNPAEVMSDRLTALTQLGGYDNLISKSYSKEYNYISYQDYYIVPVYAGRFAKSEIKESQASIRLLEYTRNQWTTGDGVKGDGETLNTGATKTDYLYTDFALSFDKDQLLIKNNPNIKVGIAFEVVARYDDVKPLDSYVTDSNTDAIRNLVKTATDSGNANGKVDTYTINNESRSVYRYEIKNSNISVKNRIEYYLRFKNSETSQQNVMKVYSYIYDKDSGEIYLSDPEYMNMYDIGNLTYITSGLANINLGPDATV